MRLRVAVVTGLLLALPATGLTSGQGGTSGEDKVLEFSTMVGVAGPFLGAANNIRGVNGGGAAWRLTDAKGRLRADGRLDVRVRGLVLVTTGANPQANFRAIVSCLTTDASGTAAATSNVVTEQFPATPEGDSDIDAVVDLPTPCIAPIVFVTNGAGTAWFAATGR